MLGWDLLLLLVLAAFFAGFVDSIVGGGGVITLPALLATGMDPHLAVGTNKVVGTGASSMATWQYARAGLIVRNLALATVPFAVAASIVGAWMVLRLPEESIIVAVSVVLVAIVVWVLVRPRLGHDDRFPGVVPRVVIAMAALALVVGFYDGLLGPGTGTFLLFGLVVLTGMPFLRAAAHGRVLNFGSNLGALTFFAVVGNIDWLTGGVMAVGTVTGAFFGSRSGIRYGVRWIRPVFVAVAVVLLVKLLLDAFL